MLWLLGTAALVAALCLAADFLRRPRSASLALHRQLTVYFIQRIIDVLGAYHGRRMERDTRRFMQVQHELTAAILRSGARTQYGRDHGLTEMHSLAEFRRRHPVTEYPHYVSYIQAVERGEESAMLGDDEVYLFAASSGTTGSSKHLLVGKRQLRRVMQNAAPLVAASQGEFGGGGAIGRTLVVTSRMKPMMSASGKRICSLSPVLQQESPLSRLLSVTPPCVDEVDTEYAACYLGLLFALRDVELHAVFTSFIFVFLRLMGVLEEQWPRLVEEIEDGRVGDHLAIPEPLLRRVNEHLTPEPGRAAELKDIFSLGFERVLPRVWPKLRFVQAARSGLAGDMYLAQAVRYLGDVPILDMAYCSSEAWLGISDGPAAEETSFTLTADACLYEFLPVAAEGGKLTPNGVDRNHLANESGVRRRAQASTASASPTSASSATSASSTGGHGNPENLPPRAKAADATELTDTSNSRPQSSNSDTHTLESRLLLADQVHVGGDYEMVVTTRSGLYRYRQGDVVRVTRFHNQAPVVQLRYRTGTDLFIEDTHVSGLALYEALRDAASRWPGRTLLEFGTAESRLDPASEGQTPHHLMFVELAGPPLSEAEAGLLDECLRARSEGYALKRSQGAIGAIRVLQMAPNVFLKLRDKMATRGQAHWTQLKRLHILRRPEDVEFLMGHVLPPTG